MKLIVLVDNNTYIDRYYHGEPAVSYYVEDNDFKMLFDVGYSDIFIKNADKLNVDIGSVETVVISHGHNDHTMGLKYLFQHFEEKTITILAHPEAFFKKTSDELEICSPYSHEELMLKSRLTLSKTPVRLSDRITFLGEIPQTFDFEKRKAVGKQTVGENTQDDYVMDDTAVVYKGEKGICVITGCSHSGICNILEYAKAVSNEDRILGVIGGFHLFEVDEQVHETRKYLMRNNISDLYPCHCTSFAVRAELSQNLPLKEVGVGLEINW